MKSIRDYTIVIRPDSNGTFVAHVPAIEGCHAWGRTPDEARADLDNVFEMISEEYRQAGRPLPPDVELSVGRATTIPIHGDAEIGNWLFHEIVSQLGITEEDFIRLLH